MRTTVNIDGDLLRKIKELAVRTNRSVSQILEEGVRILLARRKDAKGTAKATLVTYGEGGLQPGIDLDDSASLLGVLDGGHDTL